MRPLMYLPMIALWLLAGASAHAQSDEEEIATLYGDKSMVTIATGTSQPLHLAPSVATVITAEDIQAQGADDLDQVLEKVPGLHVSRSPVGYGPIYVIRGIRGTELNPEVLVLVNGVPITVAYGGDRGVNWGGWPVENIARIEVIRGPGSALYGADAFSGVINIITKTTADMKGTQVGLRMGSYNSRAAWLLHGGSVGPVAVAAYFSAGKTDGSRPTIGADAQSGLDHIFAPFGVAPVSLAPGRADNGHDMFDGNLDLAYGQWQLRTAYLTRRIGSGAGAALALDPTGTSTGQRFTSDLTYQNAAIANDWALTVQASYMHYTEHSALVLFPAGSNLGKGFFTDGVIGNPSKYERHGRLSASTSYTGFDSHRVRLGAGHEEDALYRIRESKNFNPDFSPIGTGSVGNVVDVTDTVPFIRPHTRSVSYVYVQDEWNFANDWTLTTGLRHDRYNDFGSTTNPRLALVWDAAYNVTAKLLYGSAFRAPSFLESYLINNPALIGNPALKAETIKTLEAVVSWKASPALQWDLNVFRYEMSDIIHVDSSHTYQNDGRQMGHGLELEATWDAFRNLRLYGQVGLQHSIDESTHSDAGMAARHLIRMRGDWSFQRGWLTSAQFNAVGSRARTAGDPRPPLAGYDTLDLSLVKRGSHAAWEFTATVRNLFAADQREPSPFGAPYTALPGDLPIGGRSFAVEARYRF
jgi:outer membrane receptor for ferrienterochelin and colicins